MDTQADNDDFETLITQIAAIAGIIILTYTRSALLLYASSYDKVPQHTSILMGQGWINELITGHDGHFYNEMGIEKYVF